MIMAKSCHDLDLFQQYAGSKCESLSSMGDLTWFKHENAPEGCADHQSVQMQFANGITATFNAYGLCGKAHFERA